MRKRWGIWVLFVLGFLCCCLPLLAHLYSQKEQEKVIATYQKTIQEQKRDVKELRKQAEHYNSILYQTCLLYTSDTPAWTETVSDGFFCTGCGAKK